MHRNRIYDMTDTMSSSQMAPVTFRLPPVVIGLVDELAASVAAVSTNASVSLSDVYRWAFQRYLARRGHKLPLESAFESLGFDAEGPEVELTTAATKTVCVHITSEMRAHFDSVLLLQQQQLGPMAGSKLTASQLFAAAVGELLLDSGYKLRGWNTA